MSIKRLTRVNELLRREIADILYRELAEDAVDLSAVTLTRVETSKDLRRARVHVSVRGDDATRHDVLSLLYHKRKAIQRQVNRDTTLKYTPRLSFHLDHSLEAGDHVLALLRELDDTQPEPADEPHRPPIQPAE